MTTGFFLSVLDQHRYALQTERNEAKNVGKYDERHY